MRLKDEDIKKIARLVDEGYSYINIANMINYQASAMQRIVRRYKIHGLEGILHSKSKFFTIEEKIAINYIFDIGEIVLYGISICFVLRIKRDLNRPPPSPNNIQKTPPRVNITPVTIQNPPPPQNPYPRPQPNGRPRLQPIRVEMIQRQVRIIQVEQVNSVQQLDGYNYR